jgi:hypothetical protein
VTAAAVLAGDARWCVVEGDAALRALATRRRLTLADALRLAIVSTT